MSENNSKSIEKSKKATLMDPIMSRSVNEQDKFLSTNINSMRPRKGDFTPRSNISEIQNTQSK
jgi:hypothetical protein